MFSILFNPRLPSISSEDIDAQIKTIKEDETYKTEFRRYLATKIPVEEARYKNPVLHLQKYSVEIDLDYCEKLLQEGRFTYSSWEGRRFVYLAPDGVLHNFRLNEIVSMILGNSLSSFREKSLGSRCSFLLTNAWSTSSDEEQNIQDRFLNLLDLLESKCTEKDPAYEKLSFFTKVIVAFRSEFGNLLTPFLQTEPLFSESLAAMQRQDKQNKTNGLITGIKTLFYPIYYFFQRASSMKEGEREAWIKICKQNFTDFLDIKETALVTVSQEASAIFSTTLSSLNNEIEKYRIGIQNSKTNFSFWKGRRLSLGENRELYTLNQIVKNICDVRQSCYSRESSDSLQKRCLNLQARYANDTSKKIALNKLLADLEDLLGLLEEKCMSIDPDYEGLSCFTKASIKCHQYIGNFFTPYGTFKTAFDLINQIKDTCRGPIPLRYYPIVSFLYLCSPSIALIDRFLNKNKKEREQWVHFQKEIIQHRRDTMRGIETDEPSFGRGAIDNSLSVLKKLSDEARSLNLEESLILQKYQILFQNTDSVLEWFADQEEAILPPSNAAELRDRFKKISLRLHPDRQDKSKRRNAEVLYKEFNDAYDLLKPKFGL